MARKAKFTKSRMIPATGVILDGEHIHILNPGKPKALRNVAGFYDATGFHPIRAASDYDPDRAGDDYSQRTPKKRPKLRSKPKTKSKGRR